MSGQWQYQVRIDLAAEPAEIARRDPGNPALGPLMDILARHDAIVKCQFDAFAGYVDVTGLDASVPTAGGSSRPCCCGPPVPLVRKQMMGGEAKAVF